MGALLPLPQDQLLQGTLRSGHCVHAHAAHTRTSAPAHTPHCQGEDVVAGIRTPEPIERLSQTLPDAFAELVENCNILEAHYKDMQARAFFALPLPLRVRTAACAAGCVRGRVWEQAEGGGGRWSYRLWCTCGTRWRDVEQVAHMFVEAGGGLHAVGGELHASPSFAAVGEGGVHGGVVQRSNLKPLQRVPG